MKCRQVKTLYLTALVIYAMPNLVKTINMKDADKATLEGILCQSTVEVRIFIQAKFSF
jgi:hypothetical protein